jgi:hypothetical protein
MLVDIPLTRLSKKQAFGDILTTLFSIQPIVEFKKDAMKFLGIITRWFFGLIKPI